MEKKTKQNKLIHGAYKDPALLCLLGRLSLVGVGGLEAVKQSREAAFKV